MVSTIADEDIAFRLREIGVVQIRADYVFYHKDEPIVISYGFLMI